jgi:hypothetical protein
MGSAPMTRGLVLLAVAAIAVLPGCSPDRDVQLVVTNVQIVDCPPSTQCLAVTVRNVGGDAGSGHCTLTWRSGIDAALGRTADPPSVLAGLARLELHERVTFQAASAESRMTASRVESS